MSKVPTLLLSAIAATSLQGKNIGKPALGPSLLA